MANIVRVIWSTVTPGKVRLRVAITSSAVVPDLTLITSAELRVVRQNGTVDTWSAEIIGALTTTAALIGHVFVAGDLTIAETLHVTPLIYLSGASVPCSAAQFVRGVKP